MFRIMLALAALFALGAEGPVTAQASRYAEGQVWEYRTRPGEEGSLLKIQKIEVLPNARNGELVYHLSIIGFRLHGSAPDQKLGHTPVSQETLDISVTRLSERRPDFPDAAEGIEMWREASGGVFTVSVADLLSDIEAMLPPRPSAEGPEA